MLKSLYSLIITSLILFNGCKETEIIEEFPEPPSFVNLSESVYYEIDLNDRSDDKFKVSLIVEGLSAANNIFNMPAVVPGTYRISDFGRFVADITAYDKNSSKIPLTKISNNQWEIESPEKLYRIEYEVSETWDTPVNENSIYRMGGTSIENDHALINTFGVLGYIEGLKEKEILLKIEFPDDWLTGTPLLEFSEDIYIAQDYDFLADSPLLLGNLTYEVIKVGTSDVNIYTYSALGTVSSSDISDEIESVIIDASAFLNGLPVDEYDFIYHFESERSYGALEHSYSSVHVMAERPIEGSYSSLIKSIAAHEFFHIVTPLNIHSEIIENFNFINPQASEHLWLYEGVTEWASDFMQYRNSSMSLEELFFEFESKISNDQNFYNSLISLSEISLQSYSDAGREQFGNIYNRGSMIATLLDIRLLELSNGELGVRELILDLVATYGPDNAFVDNQFFQVIIQKTFPEIETFINDYIKLANPPPYEAYFLKLGIQYNSELNEFSMIENPTEQQVYLFNQWSKNL